MAMSSETWAIVAATALGPILAVCLTLWREAENARRSKRLHVFRTLMSTRKLAISNEHVNAINLVEVDFYGCKSVQEAWKVYRAHLYDDSQGEIASQAWQDKRDNLLARLLFEMGRVLKYDIPAIEIYQGGYAPKGWLFRDNQATGAVAFFNDMANGKKALPVLLQQPAGSAQRPVSMLDNAGRNPVIDDQAG